MALDVRNIIFGTLSKLPTSPLRFVANVFTGRSLAGTIVDSLSTGKYDKALTKAIKGVISEHGLDATPKQVLDSIAEYFRSNPKHKASVVSALSGAIMAHAPEHVVDLPFTKTVTQSVGKGTRPFNPRVVEDWATWYLSGFMLPHDKREKTLAEHFPEKHQQLHITKSDRDSGLVQQLFDNINMHDEAPETQHNKAWNRAALFARHKPKMALSTAVYAALSPITSVRDNTLRYLGVVHNWGLEHNSIPVDVGLQDKPLPFLATHARGIKTTLVLNALAESYLKHKDKLPEPLRNAFGYIEERLKERGLSDLSHEHLTTGFLVGYMPVEHFRAIANATGQILGELMAKRRQALSTGSSAVAHIDLSQLDPSKLTKKTNGEAKLEPFMIHHNDKPHIYGSGILGPKVGAFFANFMGNHAVPTVDSWMGIGILGKKTMNPQAFKTVIEHVAEASKGLRLPVNITATGLHDVAQRVAARVYGSPSQEQLDHTKRVVSSAPATQAILWVATRDAVHPTKKADTVHKGFAELAPEHKKSPMVPVTTAHYNVSESAPIVSFNITPHKAQKQPSLF